jgi:hypothetical protein
MMGWLRDDTQTIFHKARDSFSIVVNFDQSGAWSWWDNAGDMMAGACAMAVAPRPVVRCVIVIGQLLEGGHYVG